MQYQSSHSTSVTTGRRTTTKGSRSLHMIAVLCLLFMDHDSFLSNFSLVQRELGNQQFPPPSYPTSSPIRSTDPKGVATDDDNNNFTTFPSIPSTPPETLGYFHIPDNSTVWVVDVEYNLCLSSYGFSACGEMNLWVWRRSEKGVQLQALQQHHAHDGEDAQQHGLVDENRHDSQNLCLGRKRFSNKLKLKSCSSSVLDGGTTYWRYDAETGMMQSFGIRSKSNMLLKNNLFGDIKCIANDHSHQSMHDYAITRKCKSFYTPLKIIPVPFAAIDNKKKSAHPSSLLPEKNPLVDEGEWKCPHTGLVIPRNLDRYFEEDDSSTHQRRFGRQVLMGAGVFTKVVFGMTFKVFTLAWYIEAEVVASSPLFAPFRDVPYEELVKSDEFYALMTRPGEFDRTLFIKAAMTLKRDLVIQGLLEELLIEPKNAKILLEASKAYTNPDCPEGMEIILTWRQPRKDPITGIMNPELFEIRFGDTMMILTEEGLAQDLIYQYFRENPVSPSAKFEYIRSMPLLLSSNYPKYQLAPLEEVTGLTSSGTENDGDPDIHAFSSHKLHYHVNRIEPLNLSTQHFLSPSSSEGITLSSAYNAVLSIMTGTYYYNHGNSGVENVVHLRKYRWYQWNLYLNSVVLQHYPKAWQEEKAVLTCIWIYLLLLIISSLPPSCQQASEAIKSKRMKRTRSIGAIKEIYYHKSASTGSPQKLEFAISPKRLSKSQSLMSLSPSISADFKRLMGNNGY